VNVAWIQFAHFPFFVKPALAFSFLLDPSIETFFTGTVMPAKQAVGHRPSR
jgi:hypothetical protein